MRRFAACLTIFLTPSALAAEGCPATIADAAKGITVGYSEGSTSVFTLDIGSGVVTEDWTQPGQPTFHNTLNDGLHLVTVVDTTPASEAGTPWNSDYLFETPPPAFKGAGQSWDIGYDLTSAAGSFQGRYTGKVGAETTLQIGACSYAAFPVAITLIEPAATNLVKVDFVPSLGFSILRGFGVSVFDFTVLTPESIFLTAKP